MDKTSRTKTLIRLTAKYLTAGLFVILLALFFWRSYYTLRSCIGSVAASIRAGIEPDTTQVEKVYNENLPLKEAFVTVNGGVQRLMGRRFVNNTYLLDNGHLNSAVPYEDCSDEAGRTVAFRDELDKLGIPLLYISTPHKSAAGDEQLPIGTEDYSNDNVDRLLSLLEQSDISCLDLRPKMKEAGFDHYSMFFRTDHHWKPESGFWAFTEIVEHLSSIDGEYGVDPAILDFSNYEISCYEDSFLGSHGWRTGPLYAGIDDFSLVAPTFPTSLSLSAPNVNIHREGDFRESLIFMDCLEDPALFSSVRYSTYLGGSHDLLRTVNRSSEQGLEVQSSNKRILMIADSFSCVVTPFLALAYDEICVVDLRYALTPLMDTIKDFAPDMVIVMYNPTALHVTSSTEPLYHFLDNRGVSVSGQ